MKTKWPRRGVASFPGVERFLLLACSFVAILLASPVLAVYPLPAYGAYPCTPSTTNCSGGIAGRDQQEKVSERSPRSTCDVNHTYGYCDQDFQGGICPGSFPWCTTPRILSVGHTVLNPSSGLIQFDIEYDFPNNYCQIGASPEIWPLESHNTRLEIWDGTNQLVGSVGVFEHGRWKPTVTVGCGAKNLRIVALTCYPPTQATFVYPLPEGCATPDRGSCPVGGGGKGAATKVGLPINVGSGDVTTTIPLFSLQQSPLPLVFNLTYHSSPLSYSNVGVPTPVGTGWTHPFNQVLTPIPGTSPQRLYHYTAEGQEHEYTQNGSIWIASRPGELRGTVTLNATTHTYELTDLDGTKTVFYDSSGSAAGPVGGWVSTTDRWGNAISGTYATGKLTTISDSAGRQLTLVYPAGVLQSISIPETPNPRVWNFSYNSGNTLLYGIGDPLRPGTNWRTLAYSGGLLASITDDASKTLEGHTYWSDGRGKESYSEGSTRNHVLVEYDQPSAGQRTVTHRIDASTNQISFFTVTYRGGRWLPTQISGPCSTCGGASGDNQSFTYTSDNHVETVTDGKNYVTRFHFNSDGNVDWMMEAYGTGLARTTTWAYAYAPWPNFWTTMSVPSAVKSGPSKTVTRSWTGTPAESQLTTTETGYLLSTDTVATSYTTLQGFDFKHRLTSLNGPRTDVSDVTGYYYFDDTPVGLDNTGRLSSITDPVSLSTTFADYDVYGTAKTTTDPNLAQTVLTMDARGRVFTRTLKAVSGDSEPTDYITTYVFDGRDRLMSIQFPRLNSTAYVYEDGTNRLTQTIRRDFSGNEQERLLYTLNDIGGRVQEDSQTCSNPAAPCGGWATPARRSEKFTYDSKNRLSQITHPVPVPADSKKLVYAYDANGLLYSVQDENHLTPNTTYGYDALNRLTLVTQTLAGAPSNQIQTVYGYDVGDNLTAVTDPNGNVTTYVFDDFHRMTRQQSHVSGLTTYTYDAFGNSYDTTDANGALTRRIYDNANRLFTATSSRTGYQTEVVTNTHDDIPANYGRGRLKSSSVSVGGTATASNAYTYDRRGLVRSDTSTISGHDYLTSYGYDGNGNRTRITYPSGRVVDYNFDFADRPASATSTTPVARMYVSSTNPATYEPFGPEKTLVFGNGTTRTASWNLRYQPSTLTLTGGSVGPAVNYSYAMDPAGSDNITGITDNGNAAYNRTFGYDDLNRLTTATTGTGGSPPLWGSPGTFTYYLAASPPATNQPDVMNRTYMSLGSRSVTYAYDISSNKYTPRLKTVTEGGTGTSVARDAAGNETTFGAVSSTCSPRNNLASPWAETPQLSFDGRGVRVGEKAWDKGELPFNTVTPCRVVDTRTGSGFPPDYGPPSITGGAQRTFTIAGRCGIPAGAQAVSLNVTVWAPVTRGDLRIFPAGGATPTVSTLNWEANILALANAAIVPLTPQGQTGAGAITVQVDGTGTVDIFIDVNGYFPAPGSTSDLSFRTLTPCRLIDTRIGSGLPSGYGPPSIAGGAQRTFVLAGQCSIPANAASVSLNFTVWAPVTRGDLRVFPAGGTVPLVSTLNWEANILALANAAIVPVTPQGQTGAGAITVQVDGTGTIDLIVDVNGYFPTPGDSADLTFHTVPPCRVVDTRTGSEFPSGYGSPSIAGGAQRSFTVAGRCGIPSSDVKDVSFNFTAWAPVTRGDLRVFPAGGTAPLVSTLNWEANILALANAALVPLSQPGAITVQVDGTGTIDLIVDVNGYFTTPALTTRNLFYSPEMNLLSETTATLGAPAPAPLYEYIWFNGRPVAQETVNDSTALRYTMTDHLGTPFLQTNTSGAITWRAEYDPFGNLYAQRVIGSPDYQPLRFPGQEERSTTPGRYYNMFRWYRPDVGAYTQTDPVGLHRAGSYAGANLLYGYADDRPTGLTDPLGLYVPTEGCTPEEHKKIQVAGGKAEAAANTCLPCGEVPLQWALRIRHSVWHCDHRGSDGFCGIHGKPRPDPPFYNDTGHDISLGPGGLGESKFCGCLQATMLHEVAHYFGYQDKGPKNAYDIEKPCFKCAGEKP